jgi:hypothetical protein
MHSNRALYIPLLHSRLDLGQAYHVSPSEQETGQCSRSTTDRL